MLLRRPDRSSNDSLPEILGSQSPFAIIRGHGRSSALHKVDCRVEGDAINDKKFEY